MADQLISVYSTTFDPYDSYGLIASELILGLSHLGYHVNCLTVDRDRVLDWQSEELRQLICQPFELSLGGVMLGYPTMYHKYGLLPKLGPRIGITMFESTQIPEKWIEPLNDLDAVILPANWLVPVFREAGVVTPLHVVPLGVSPTYRFVDRSNNDGPYTFICSGDRGRRKGWHLAVWSFVGAFGDDPNYRLIVKARKNGMGFHFTNPNIITIEEDYTEEEMCRLYGHADCMINANLGEGFGLHPRQFAATGGLALATQWGGTAEQINDWGVPIPIKSEVSAWEGEEFEGLGKWAEPDLDELTALLVSVAERGRLTYEESKSISEVTRTIYSWDTFVRYVAQIYEGIGGQNVSHGYTKEAIPS